MQAFRAMGGLSLLLSLPSVLFITLHVFGLITEGSYEHAAGDTYAVSGLLSLPCAVIVLGIWMLAWARGGATDRRAGLWVLVAGLGAVLTFGRMWL